MDEEKNPEYVVVYGPPKSGKTLNRAALMKHFECDDCIDFHGPYFIEKDPKRVLVLCTVSSPRDLVKVEKFLPSARAYSITQVPGLLGKDWVEPELIESPVPASDRALDLAAGLVYGHRNEDYGPPSEDFACAAEMIQAYLRRAHGAQQVFTRDDLPMVMILVKLARQAHRPKGDNLVDICGYAECAHWIYREAAE